MIKINYLKKLFLLALFVAIGARLYFSFFVDGFIITFTAIILALSLFFNDDVHPVHLGALVAFISPSVRFSIEYFWGDPIDLMARVYPDVFFYLIYGLVFYGLKRLLGPIYKSRFFIVAFFSDFLSNFVELLIRTKIVGLDPSMVQGIILVAIGRTFVIMIFIYLAINYSTLLVKQEHEKRYQHLMMQSSRFKSEIYFLHKNMQQIEQLTSLSHRLKKQAKEDEALKNLALELSKDVHEVKKDYLRVIRGLEEIYDDDMDIREVSLKDLFHIIEVNTNDYLRSKNCQVTCHYYCKLDIMVHNHFYLMSILRNLINNGIDACGDKGRIDVVAQEVDNRIQLYIKDSGSGIEPSDESYIFNTGFSTKFDEHTGNINRGIGLTLVKEMVENIFNGTIAFDTTYGKGTTFLITMTRETLREGSHYEILSS